MSTDTFLLRYRMQSVNKYFSPHAVTCVCLFQPDGNLTPKDADE